MWSEIGRFAEAESPYTARNLSSLNLPQSLCSSFVFMPMRYAISSSRKLGRFSKHLALDGAHIRRVNNQRINDQDVFCVVERSHARAHQLLSKIHDDCGSLMFAGFEIASKEYSFDNCDFVGSLRRRQRR